MNKCKEALDYVNKSVCIALACLEINDPETKESLHILQELVNKLENIEEKLGCPLDVVFKALEEGIEYEIEIETYYVSSDILPTKRIEKRKNIQEIKLKKYINKFAFFVPYDYSRTGIVQSDIIYLKDYQKTWWLRGEKKCLNK